VAHARKPEARPQVDIAPAPAPAPSVEIIRGDKRSVEVIK